MNWDSPAEFFAMGGHAVFVWGSYAAFALVVVAEAWSAARRRRQALRYALRTREAAQQEHGT